MNEISINISGNVISDPIIRRTRGGDAFVSFRVAVNEKKRTAEGTWADGDTHYFGVTAFRTLAANAYHSLAKGQYVMVSGRLRIVQYEGKDGTMRTSAQIDAYDIGASVKFGQTTFEKVLHPQVPSVDRLADEVVTEVNRRLDEDGVVEPEHSYSDDPFTQPQEEAAQDGALVGAAS